MRRRRRAGPSAEFVFGLCKAPWVPRFLRQFPAVLKLPGWWGSIRLRMRQMLLDMGVAKATDHGSTVHGSSAKASPQSARQATRVFVRVARGALKGSRYAAIVGKRATLIVTVVSSVTSGVIAYRELTTAGFAVLVDV